MNLKTPHRSYQDKSQKKIAVVSKMLVMMLSLFLLTFVSNDINAETKQQSLNQLAKNLKIQYQVIDNRPTKDCDKKQGHGFCFLAKLSLQLNTPVSLNQWRIYFSHMSPIQKVLNNQFNIVRVNGDLHYIEPTEFFAGWDTVKHVEINFKAAFWHISEFDVPPNFYIVSESLKPVLIESTKAKIDAITKLEQLPFMTGFTSKDKQFKRTVDDNSDWINAEKLYQRNTSAGVVLVDVTTRIIPKPEKLIVNNADLSLDLSKGVFIKPNKFGITAKNPALQRLNKLGVKVNNNTGIPIIITQSDLSIATEGYQLQLTTEQIKIEASKPQGVFYAIQSLNSLLQLEEFKLPILTIIDKPRYEFRGLLLDVARNFRDKTFVLKLLEQMAAYKLNKLHLHLSDDEGWRLEIPGLPELTQVGSQRCFEEVESKCLLTQLGNGPEVNYSNNGFYSLEDYRQILKYAKARHIEIIPSFDMPGHSRAAVKSMQARYKKYISEGKLKLAEEYLLSDLNDKSQYTSVQYYNDNTVNVCRESTYTFIEKIINEVSLLHESVNVPLKTYHIGADETAGAWKESPICKNFLASHPIKFEQLSDYFVTRVAAFLDAKQIQVAGWNDGLAHIAKEQMPDNVQVNAWTPLFWNGHKTAHSIANKDWQVILSLPDVTYFDFPYEADPKERGYYWASRYTNTQQVFDFMPDNLPLHAEIWTDRENKPFTSNDRHQAKSAQKSAYSPLLKGKKFKGIQGQLWGEMVRSNQIAEYMLFPRLLGLAERAWHKADWEPDYNYQGAIYSAASGIFTDKKKSQRKSDWQTFANTLGQKELTKLDLEQWLYRLPTVGAIVKNHRLFLNVTFPGLIIEYQLDEQPWKVYLATAEGILIKPEQVIKIRSRSPDQQRASRETRVINF